METESAQHKEKEAQEEAKHFNSCVRAFLEYGRWLAPEFQRRLRHRSKLSTDHLNRLGGDQIFKNRHQTATNCLASNAELLVKSVSHNISHAMRESWHHQEQEQRRKTGSSAQHSHSHSHSHGHGNGSPSACTHESHAEEEQQQQPQIRLAPERHMVKVRSTLKQIVRDWSSVGQSERDSCYGPLIDALKQHLPVSTDNFGKQKVLVPGSGLGRLVFDLAVMGYDTQGNEFSYFMLLMGDFIMNKCQSAECHTVYPWLGSSNNFMSREEEFVGVAFPDVHPGAMVHNAPGQVNMSVAAGEFLDCYDNQENYGTWDGVATCFFIDTAPNVIDYIAAISKMLKSGGIWTNVGPLEYHWMTFRDNDVYERDERYLESVELAYSDIKKVIVSYGFEYIQEERKQCFYSSRSNAMKKTLFDCVAFTVRKKEQ